MIKSISIDIPSKEIIIDGEAKPVTDREFNVILYLAKNKGIYKTRQEIINGAWENNFKKERVVDVAIVRVRRLTDFSTIISRPKGEKGAYKMACGVQVTIVSSDRICIGGIAFKTDILYVNKVDGSDGIVIKDKVIVGNDEMVLLSKNNNFVAMMVPLFLANYVEETAFKRKKDEDEEKKRITRIIKL